MLYLTYSVLYLKAYEKESSLYLITPIYIYLVSYELKTNESYILNVNTLSPVPRPSLYLSTYTIYITFSCQKSFLSCILITTSSFPAVYDDLQQE